jgi:cysteine synthase
MKIYPAEYCIRRALEECRVGPKSLIVETSSGTMALALSTVCNVYGHRLSIVTDYACDDVLRLRMEELGTTVHIVPGPAATGGYQRARLDKLHQLCSEEEDYFWVNQYDNPANAGSYSAFATQLVESLGRVDCLIGSVGSGGSMSGTSRYLRMLLPGLKLVGVDTFGSVLFGQPDGPRQLRGLGNSLLPKNLNHTDFDEVHWVSAGEAFTATRLLHRKHTLFRGGTSGATWLVARHWAQQHPDEHVVCIFPDDGYRYVNTIYNDSHLRDNGLLLDLPEFPREVEDPLDAGPSWSWMNWNRRRYEDACGLSAALLQHA